MFYSPVSYYTLGAVYPRERLRRPWPKWAHRDRAVLDYETIVILIPGTYFPNLEGIDTSFQILEGTNTKFFKLDGIDNTFYACAGLDTKPYLLSGSNEP